MNINRDRKKESADAESLMKLARSYTGNEEYSKAEDAFHCLLGLEGKSIDLVINKAQVLKNQKKLEEATLLLEKAIEIGFVNSKMLHVLAVLYCDGKLWLEAERCIFDIIKLDVEYSLNISFAIFSADILRKREYVKTSYSIITSAILMSQCLGSKVPLKAFAIQQELEYEVLAEYSIEVSHRFYNAIYESSEKYASDSNVSIYVPVWDKVLSYFQDNDILSVVDIGCGPGQFAEYAVNRLPDLSYTGFDFSSVAISQAKKRTKKADFIEGNAFTSPLLTENAADVYILLEVLEHIEKDLDLLGGMPSRASVVFSVPNFDSFGHVRFFLDEKEVYDRYSYLFSNLEVMSVVLKGYSTIYLSFGQLK